MTEEHSDHKELYFQIRQNTAAVSELRTQVALTVQAVASMATSLGKHIESGEKNASSFKDSAITAGFSLLTILVAAVVGGAFIHFTGQ
jgi:uncharacterized membrane protein